MTRSTALYRPGSTGQALPVAVIGRRLLPWLLPLGLLVLWCAASKWHWTSKQVLPAPALVWQSAVELASGDLWLNVWISLKRLAAGVAAGVLGGALLGAWLGSNRLAERMVLPTFVALAQVPTLAWIPLFMLCFGIGEALKLVVLVKAVVVPVTLHTLVGVRDAQPRLREAATVLGLSRSERIRLLMIPAALPAFLAGVRLALAAGWASLLAVELLASSEGLGYLMVWARQLFMLDIVFVCIAVIGLLGLAMDRGLGALERRLVFWPHPAIAQLRPGAATGPRWQAWVLPLVLFAAWHATSRLGWVNPELLPSPLRVAHTLVSGTADGTLPQALLTSLTRALGGLAIGAGLGLAFGLLLGLWQPAHKLFGATFSGLRQVAIFAWVPLITTWCGLGEPAKWAFVALAAFFPMLIAAQRGVAQLPPTLIEAACVLRLNRRQRLARLVLPGCAPSLFAGLRVALIYAWLGTIGAEYFMPSNGGIGSLMISAQQLLRMDQILAGMVLVGLTGALLNALGQTLERRATRWRHA